MYLVQTVQTASPWRPQLPLPKDITLHVQQEQQRQKQDMDKSSAKKDKDKKWSLGNLFRRKQKKELEYDSSSEEDRKAGFLPVKNNRTQAVGQSGTLNGKRKKRSSKLGAFDHIVVSSNQGERYGFKESDSVNSIDKYVVSMGSGSLDRRSKKDRGKEKDGKDSSSDGESHRSSSMSRFRSDDSLGNHSGSSNRKSRTARTERYLKRMSKDEEGSPVSRWHTQPVSPSMLHGSIQSVDNVHRRGYVPSGHPSLRNSSSLTNVPHLFHPPNPYANQQQVYQVNPAATYENSFYIQSKANSIRDAIRSPPPVPPRDPQRRLTIGHPNDVRPISYAFDRCQTNAPPPGNIWQPNGKCVSDDRLWGSNVTLQQHVVASPTLVNPHAVTPPRPASVQPEAAPKRYISRHPQQSNPSPGQGYVILQHNHNHNHHHHQPSQPLPQHQQTPKRPSEYRYVTDVTPRSRKPIQIQDRTFEPYEPQQYQHQQLPMQSQIQHKTPPPQQQQQQQPTNQPMYSSTAYIRTRPLKTDEETSSKTPQQSASAFWRKIEEEQNSANRRARAIDRRQQVPGVNTSRSVSTSRALEIMNHKNYELTKELSNLLDDRKQDDQGNVISGRLYLRQGKDGRMKEKSRSPPKNKYEEYVAKTIAQSTQAAVPTSTYKKYSSDRPVKTPPTHAMSPPPPPPPTRGISKRNSCSEEELSKKQKSANLEEAINELEAIYKSLRLSDEDLLDRAELRDVPTPTMFTRQVRPTSDYDDDEEERRNSEPDIQLDDLSFRSIKRAKETIKSLEVQPPFGIPLGPIPPSPGTDYLSVQPSKPNKPRFIPKRSPDLVADDLAYRQLRRDRDLQQSVDRVNNYHATTDVDLDKQPASIVEDVKKKRNSNKVTSNTLSSNIYNLIQRDAAKPSGGNLADYYQVEKTLTQAIAKVETEEVPSAIRVTPKGSRSHKKTDHHVKSGSSKMTGGAVFNLPSTLKSSSPKPAASDSSSSTPTTSTTVPKTKTGGPVIVGAKHKAEFEDILNAIAQEAKSTSEQLGMDLAELRKETKSVSSGTSPETKPKSKAVAPKDSSESRSRKSSVKTESEIDEVAEAAKFCHQMLRNVVEVPKLDEKKLVKDIEDTSNAAMLCHGMINRVMLPKQVPVEVPETSVLSNLMKELAPVEGGEEETFDTLSKRCQEQLNELEDTKDGERSAIERDYDNLVESCKPLESDSEKKSTEEEIDMIMKECGIESDVQITINSVPLERQDDADTFDSRKYSKESSLELSDFHGPSITPTGPKSSSETEQFPMSSDLTSCNLLSSSDCLKSNSDRHKSSSSATSSIISAAPATESTIVEVIQVPVVAAQATPSPPLPSDAESQYNSSEELAMIFGIKSPTPTGNSNNSHERSKDSLLCASEKHGVSATTTPNNTNTITNTNTNTSTSANSRHHELDSYYRNVTSFTHGTHLDTIVEELHEFELDCCEVDGAGERQLTNPDIESTTTDSGNVSLNDFGSEFTAERRVTFVNEFQIDTGYPFRSVVQIPEIYIEDMDSCDQEVHSSSEDEKDVIVEKEHREEVIEDPKVESLEEFERLAKEQRSKNDSTDETNLRRRTSSENRPESYRPRDSQHDQPASSGKSQRSGIVQPQHVVLACTYGLANSSFDYITVIAIIIAIITLFALIVL